MINSVLVLGRRGMLGSMITRILSRDTVFKICATTTNRDDEAYFDASGPLAQDLDLLWQKKGPFDYVINAIALTSDRIDLGSEQSRIAAIKLNALFPHALAQWTEGRGIRLVHVSSDGVFSGKDGPYDEDAPHDCLDFYGKTKSLGEPLGGHVLNLRCSLIGPSPFHHRGLMEWFLSQPAGGSIEGFTDEYWNGVTTYQLAQLMARIIKECRFDALRAESPVFHLASPEPLSKYELLKLMAEIFEHRLTVNPGVSCRGGTRRVLTSRYNGLKSLIPAGDSLKEGIALLKPWVGGR